MVVLGVSAMYFPRFFFFFQAEDGIRDKLVTGVQTCALPILPPRLARGDGTREGRRRGPVDAHGVAAPWSVSRRVRRCGRAGRSGRGVRYGGGGGGDGAGRRDNPERRPVVLGGGTAPPPGAPRA